MELLEEEVQSSGRHGLGLLDSLEVLEERVFRMECLREEAAGRAAERVQELKEHADTGAAGGDQATEARSQRSKRGEE